MSSTALSLGAIPVKVVQWLPDGSLVAIGAKGERPDNWDEMTDASKMSWCIEHNAKITISPDVWLALKEEAAERDVLK